MRCVITAGLVAAAGCGPSAPSSATPPADAPPLDFAGWPALTPAPVRLAPRLFALCITPPEAKRLGPHFVPQARYLVNPDGEAAVRGGLFPVPAGTTVVKAKGWADCPDQGEWFAAMTKREPGYDPAGGDWEYLTARREGGRWQVERGPLADCSGCHQQAAGTDFLFRGYLSP
jgi:hypothetical protein